VPTFPHRINDLRAHRGPKITEYESINLKMGRVWSKGISPPFPVGWEG
jgi:hypothetical protein